MISRADLHVHSKFSNQPTEWILRTFRAPESFTEPLDIYRTCRERGMDFVTISDHDTIDGALEIAHLPGAFVSCEVTATFPEDRCEVHVLVFGISEGQHREIQELRGNLYELRDYLRDHDVACSVAHPLFRVNGRLTLDHFEKLLVLFNRFETLNGMHDRRLNGMARKILTGLSPELIDLLAGRHGIEPWGPTPWVKGFTGGTDDHAGLYMATTWTATRRADGVGAFLGQLRAGRCDAGGATGSAARLARSLQSLAGEYFRRHLPAGRWLHPRLLDAASRWVSVQALNKGSDLLDRASMRFHA
ncbi:MAG TPA: PHP domain-containing protein [Thermoanaerobaculia bacterium]|nr:PHP domain-containing protein [Thermoanaerobaculia bacterium]